MNQDLPTLLNNISNFVNFSYKGPVINRVNSALQLPIAFVWHTLAASAGVVQGLQLGMGNSLPRIVKWTVQSRFIVATPYLCFLKMINPHAKIDIPHEGNAQDPYPAVQFRGNGLLSNIVKTYLYGYALRKYDSEVLGNITTRLTFAIAVVALTVTRAVDGIIGITAGTAAILTVGYFESLNHLAFRGLQFTGVIADWQLCGIGFVNPSAVAKLANSGRNQRPNG